MTLKTFITLTMTTSRTFMPLMTMQRTTRGFRNAAKRFQFLQLAACTRTCAWRAYAAPAVAIAFTFLIATTPANAAQPQTPPPAQTQTLAQDAANPRAQQARQRLEELQQRLQLTPEQQEQVRPIFIDELQQLKSVRDRYGSSGDNNNQNRRTKLKMARELRDVQKSTDEKLKKILSSKQMDELKKVREEWRQQFRDRAGAQ